MAVNSYELVLISKTDASEKELIEEIKKAITSASGRVENIESWGKKELAYPIKKQREGVYNLITFTASSNIPVVLNSKLNLIESVIRFIIVKREKEKSLDGRRGL